MAFRSKTGGRQKGTPNKATNAFRLVLQREKFSIPEEAVKLYRACTDPEIQLRALRFMADFSSCRPTEDPDEDPIDITPEEEALSDGDLTAIASGSTNGQPSASDPAPLAPSEPPMEASSRPIKIKRNPKKR